MGASEGTIAALLRHSTTALVKRYAHLSPSHLRAAVEGVANFGKVTIKEGKTPECMLDGASVPNGTVTQTGSDETGEVEETTEVVD